MTAMDLAPFQPLAAALQPFLAKGLCKFVVTSSGPAEGKSTVTANLARALAKSGRLGVLAVDADPIKPTLHQKLGVENRRGIGNLLREIYELDLSRENPDQFGIGDWVELLRAQGKTGTLHVRQDGEEFQVVFQRGRITSISGGPQDPEGRLGERLVHEGRITHEQRDVALKVQREGPRRLGEVLRGLGYAAGAEIDAALEQQLKDSLHRIVTLQRPRYDFSEAGHAYLPTATKQQEHDDGTAIDAFVTGRLSEYLKHPFLASQIPSYFTDTGMDNLKLLTSGTVRFDVSDRPFAILSDRLARNFDVVLLDTPPVALTSPTGSLTSVAHGVLLVVKAEGYDLRIVQQAKEQLIKSGAHLLGVVLNQVDVRHDESLTYYYGAYKR
jgi:MinD-like ATPase involved in chromosome partitioning or flagellar assembly